MVFVARMLGKETYGQFVVVQSTLSMVGAFAGFGIGTTATRYVAELRLRDSVRLAHILALTERSILTFGLIATVLLALLSGFLASGVLNTPDLVLPLSIAASSVLFSALDSYQRSVLIGLEAMRAFAVGTIVGAAASVPIMLMLANMYGLNGVAGAMVLSTLIQSGISRIQVADQLKRFGIRREAQGCLKEWRVLRDFALPALLGGILVAPAHWICQTLLANTPNGYAELAVLGVAMQWFNVVIFLPNIAGRVLLPILTEHFANGDHGQSAKALKLAIISNLAVVIPVALTIALISPWIMLAYGSQFRDGAQSLALVAFVAILYVGALPVGQILSAGGRMWLGATLNLGWAIVFLSSTFFLVKHGAVGFIVSMGIAYLVHAIWVGLYAARHLADLKAVHVNIAVINAVK
jgi:O-antigen/teichoic acid export membrane protein